MDELIVTKCIFAGMINYVLINMHTHTGVYLFISETEHVIVRCRRLVVVALLLCK